jgi:uncharacterized protein (UPF0276 family)
MPNLNIQGLAMLSPDKVSDTQHEVALPKRAGVSLKPEHYNLILTDRPDVGWFEVHPENYMGAGGPPHRYLSAVCEQYPLSLHGVGLSIGSAGALDGSHIARLKALVDRYQPAQVSEHLAWSSHEGEFLNDLLPLPYTQETLDTVVDHIDEVQNAIGRRILLENPSTYVVFSESTFDEIDFLIEIVRRADCGLLLDVNNVHVSCINHNRDAEDYIDRFPLGHVGEIHLAGHAEDTDDGGTRLLIDSHDRAVIDDVWQLYTRVIAKAGPLPTLIEWDSNIPDWPILHREAKIADAILAGRAIPKPGVAAHEMV